MKGGLGDKALLSPLAGLGVSPTCAGSAAGPGPASPGTAAAPRSPRCSECSSNSSSRCSRPTPPASRPFPALPLPGAGGGQGQAVSHRRRRACVPLRTGSVPQTVVTPLFPASTACHCPQFPSVSKVGDRSPPPSPKTLGEALTSRQRALGIVLPLRGWRRSRAVGGARGLARARLLWLRAGRSGGWCGRGSGGLRGLRRSCDGIDLLRKQHPNTILKSQGRQKWSQNILSAEDDASDREAPLRPLSPEPH